MTFDEAITSPLIRRASWRVWSRFRYVPGFYLSTEDLKQVAAWRVWLLGDKVATLDKPLLYATMLRDMYDYARAHLDFGRARFEANDMPIVYSLDHWLEAGREIKSPKHSPFNAALEGQLLDLIDDRRCRLTPKERRTAKLYFHHDFTKSEVAAFEHVSAARISQLIKSSIAKMRRHVIGDQPKADKPWLRNSAA